MNLYVTFIQLLPETMLLLSALGIIAVSVACAGKSSADATTLLLAVFGIIAAIITSAVIPIDTAIGGSLLCNDALAQVVRPWLFALALPAILVAPNRRQLTHAGEFTALMLFALIGLSLAACSRHLLMLFTGLELAGLSFYILTGLSRTREAADAAIRYFLFGGVAAAFLLFGCSLIYGFAPALTFDAIALGTKSAGTIPLFVPLGLLMILVGLCFKLAVAPFHFWAPDVYQKAPIAAVTLISAASKLTALVVLTRLLLLAFPALAGNACWGEWASGWSLWLGVLAAVSMILGNLLALGQKSVRRLLAYSAVANAGYALIGIAAGGAAALATALHYIIIYGLATAGGLIVTAVVAARTGSDDLKSFNGLWRRSPGMAIAMIVFMGSLAGLPPMAGFAGKFALFSQSLGVAGPGFAWLVGIAVVMSAVSLYYYLSVLRRVMEEPKQTGTYEKLEPGAAIAIFMTAAAVVVLGISPSLLLSPLAQALQGMVP